jgi:hypothetical protein
MAGTGMCEFLARTIRVLPDSVATAMRERPGREEV